MQVEKELGPSHHSFRIVSDGSKIVPTHFFLAEYCRRHFLTSDLNCYFIVVEARFL
jgi:hypothetical protein